MGYHAGKPIESVVYCLSNRALAQAELKPRSSIYDAKRFTGKKFSKDDLRKLSTLYQFRVTLMKTKLTGNEFYRYKIEAQQCFTLKWFHFEPSS